MKANTLTPEGIFGTHVRYVVPLFQRPYVWTKRDQWEPLWEDVKNLTERLLDAPPAIYGSPPVPPHFLGAIVLDAPFTQTGFIGVRHVVDGQQRLTTLQLLLDAAQWVVHQHGTEMDAQALRILVLNDAKISLHPDDRFKVWPTDRDQDAFRAAMDNDTEVDADLATSRVAQAHAYFVAEIMEWVDVTGDPAKVAGRLNGLVHALREHLKVVVIDLEPGDNAQVIFETLNHRGSPLLAADLIKNFVFQVAQAQNADVVKLYRDHWKPLDSDAWRSDVAQGRLYRPRIDVFLNYWLTMKLLKDVPTDRIFTEFRDHVMNAKPPIDELLAEIAADAQVYADMDKHPANSVEGIFHYRVLKALDSAAVGPFLLWVLRWPEQAMPMEQRSKALRAVESWLARRALCRMTAKGVNLLVVELLRELDRKGPSNAGDTTEAFLAGQTADARLWPDDLMMHAALDAEPLYAGLARPRLRMVLEALEDHLRGPLTEDQRCPRGLTVEHVMPQGWKTYWGADISGDDAAAVRRDRLVQSLGNLSLVNDKLNPTLSNRPWTTKEAQKFGLGDGKRDYLFGHSTLKLNATVVAEHVHSWSEADIRDRGADMVTTLTQTWAHPDSPG